MSITGAGVGGGGLHETGAVGASAAHAESAQPAASSEAAAAPAVRDGAAMRLENGVGSAALRGRVEAALAPEAAPELGPIDLDAVRGGTAEFEWSLKAGRHRIDVGGDEPLILDVKRDTTLRLEGRIAAGENGPRLTDVRLRFSHEVSIANPGAVIDKSWEEVADALVDVNVRSIAAGPDGKLHVDGKIDGPFGLDRDLDGLIPAGERPDASFDLKRLLGGETRRPATGAGAGRADAAAAAGGAPRPAAAAAAPGARAAAARPRPRVRAGGLRPDRLLEGLGPVLEPGRFEVRLQSEQNTLVVGDRSVVIAGCEPGDARVEIRGTADVDDTGRFVIGAEATLHSAVADADVRLDGRLGLAPDGAPRGELRSRVRVDVKDADVLELRNGVRLHTDGAASDKEVRGQATVRWTEAGRVVEGRLRADLEAQLAARGAIGDLSGSAEARASLGADLQIEERAGQPVEVRGPVHLEVQPTAGRGVLAGHGPRRPPVPVRIRSADSVIVGDMEIEARGDKVRVRDGELDLHMGLGVDGSLVQARQGRFVFDGEALAVGRARIGLDPERGVEIRDGELSVKLGVQRGRIHEGKIELELGEGSSLTAVADGITFGPEGLRVGGTRTTLDFRVVGPRARVNNLELAIDPNETSVIQGETDLFTLTESGRLEEREAGRAQLRLELHATDARLRNNPRTDFGERAKTFRGEATLEFHRDRVRVLEGKLSADLDLGGTEIQR
ncbi:MAG: hypothetical protein D6776_11525 [Planctomycetota bacterium]|nr:MAG: hypothetical protein D6776_11525 [Planctomycetota bacterium]